MSFLFGELQSRYDARNFSRQQATVNPAIRRAQTTGDANRAGLLSGLRQQQRGFDLASKGVGFAQRGAERDARESAQALQGRALSRYVSGGKYGTTAMDQARIGIQARLSRELEGIQTAFADALGGIEMDRGRAALSGGAALASNEQATAAQVGQLSRALAGMSRESVADDGSMKDILSIIGSLYGAKALG